MSRSSAYYGGGAGGLRRGTGHAGHLKRSVRRYYFMGGYVRQCQHGVKENDRELPDPARGGVSGLSAAYRFQY